MTKLTYNIGDRIIIRAYEDIPAESRTKATGRLCGKKGTITDKLYSECFDGFVYAIKFEDRKSVV